MQVVKKEFCCRLVWCQFYENRFKASIYCTFEAADIDSFPLGIFWITFVFKMVVSMYRMFHNDAIQTHIEPSFEKHTCKICISYNRSHKKHFVTIYECICIPYNILRIQAYTNSLHWKPNTITCRFNAFQRGTLKENNRIRDDKSRVIAF